MMRWLCILLLFGAVQADESCTAVQAEAIWASVHGELQVLLGGQAVRPPKIMLYASSRDLPGNANDGLLARYQFAEQTIHVPCSDQISGNALDMAIRHEATHHYLGLVFGRLPGWLEEGLATYMEVRKGADGLRINAARRDEFVDMLKWGLVPGLERLITGVPSQANASRYYAAYWALLFAMLHPHDPALQSSRHQLLLSILKKAKEGTGVMNKTLLDGLRSEQEDWSAWQLRWRRQIWDLPIAPP